MAIAHGPPLSQECELCGLDTAAAAVVVMMLRFLDFSINISQGVQRPLLADTIMVCPRVCPTTLPHAGSRARC